MISKRLSVDIERKVYMNFIDIIPWGYKCQVVRALLDMCIEVVAKNGITTISDILKGKCYIKYKEVEDVTADT